MESLKPAIIRLMILLLGFTSMSVQVILLRESLAIFSGNELIIGLFLGIWMVLTAGSAFLAVQSSKFKVQSFGFKIQSWNSSQGLPVILMILLAVLPLASLFLLIILRYSMIPHGITPGLGETALVISLSILPFCIVSGMLFPIQVQSLSDLKGRNLLHEGYALDSAGSIVGGILFSLFLIFTLPPYESLVLLSSAALAFLCILYFIIKQYGKAVIALILAVFVFSLPAFQELVKYFDDKQFNKQEVLEIVSSPFGLLAVSKMDDQVFIYENGVPVSLGDDPVLREESVHYAMLLHPSPDRVLMISGAASGRIEEALKYATSGIDYIDRDPWLLRVLGRYRPLPDNQRVSYFFEDARIFLNKTDNKYDVILVNIADPESAEMNRYYTLEFYKLLKNKLNHGGIISVSTVAAGNYMNETSRMVHSVIFNTLKSVFNHVRIIPGGKDYFLSSDSTIEQSIFSNYEIRGINNEYVNPNYINENLLRMRSDMILKDIQPGTQINSDLKPYVFSLFLKQWMARFKINSWLIPLILILLMIFSLVMFGPLNLGLFAGGFTVSSIEFTLLLWLQVIFGFAYLLTGIVFAVFMAGMVMGALQWQKILKTGSFRKYIGMQGMMAIFSGMVAVLIFLVPTSTPSNGKMVLIMALVFIAGLLMGIQFALSADLRKSSPVKSAGEAFSADLLGSAAGMMMVSIYLVPLIGLPITALSLAGLNIIAVAAIASKKRP